MCHNSDFFPQNCKKQSHNWDKALFIYFLFVVEMGFHKNKK